LAVAVVFALLLMPPTVGQLPPDLGPVGAALDEVLGQVVPPALNTTYALLGQNITREDVRIFADINITKGDVGLFGLVVGSGIVDVQADIYLRVEFRVIAVERIKDIVIGDDPFNMTGPNSTFLQHVYLPADVFRLTLTAEAVALFQAEQEAALRDSLNKSAPEVTVLELQLDWSNTFITDALTDLDLTEPPIVVEVHAVLHYLRVESLGSLLRNYIGLDADPVNERVALLQELKDDNSKPLHARDFFAAAAYTQLLNLSMQPGWSLDLTLRVPRGFTFEYFNENVHVSPDRRTAAFRVDASTSDTKVEEVLVASLTQRRAVALALFVGIWLVAGLLILPVRSFYVRQRVPRLLLPPDAADKKGSSKRGGSRRT
jgi:hypothetical protein